MYSNCTELRTIKILFNASLASQRIFIDSKPLYYYGIYDRATLDTTHMSFLKIVS